MAKHPTLGNKKLVLLLGDVAILYLSLWITLFFRYGENFSSSVWSEHLLPFTVVFGLLLVIFYIDDLYQIELWHGNISVVTRLLRDVIIGGFFSVVFFYIGQNRLFSIRPQTVLVLMLLISGAVIFVWHVLFLKLTRTRGSVRGIVVVGYNSLVEEIIQRLEKLPQLQLSVKAIIPTADYISQNINIPTVNLPISELKNICKQYHTHIIISTVHPRTNSELSKSLFECLPLKLAFYDVATFYEKITGKIPVTSIEQVWFLENLTEDNKKVYESVKRLFDIIISLSLLVLFLPFAPFIALAIKLKDYGPVFFTQIRTGKENIKFTAIKFRTMVNDAEKSGPVWAAKNDPRVTTFGKFLRKTRIDEIPQLINVIKGEMSLIGPRPERPEFIEQLSEKIPFYKERLLVKPGLTGWAQVYGPAYGGSAEESLEKLQYDLFYIKNRSFGLDISITLKTIKTILLHKGQ